MDISKWFRIRGPQSIYLYSVLIGIFAGLGAYLFSFSLAYFEHLTFDYLIGLERSHPSGEIHFEGDRVAYNPYMLFFLPIIGGLLVGLLTHFLCSDAAGTGTDAMIHAFHRRGGRIRGRVPFFKFVATIMTISSGGSAGQEGPAQQIGGGVGSVVARFLNAGDRARRTLLLAGVAGGLGAIFRAPFGGAMTAVEVVYRKDIESDSLVPAILSSVTGYMVYTAIAGSGSVFSVPEIDMIRYYEIPFYIVLGLICSGAGMLFVRIFKSLQVIFSNLKLHPVFRPALGGAFVGCAGLFFPEVIGTGFGFVQDVLQGNDSYSLRGDPFEMGMFFFLIAGLKMLTTSFTVSSGGSGGVFGPSFFIGGMLGGAFASFSNYLFPGYQLPVTSFMLVGMGSFFAGIASAPLAGMIMVSDLIGSYILLPPLMLVAIIASITAHSRSIYSDQVDTRFQSPAHYWDMNLDILETIRVKDAFRQYRDLAIIPDDRSIRWLHRKAPEIQASDFVVSGENKEYRGMISLRKIPAGKRAATALISSYTDSAAPVVNDENSLGEALKILNQNELDKVAVVHDGFILGYLRYSDIMKAYHNLVRKE